MIDLLWKNDIEFHFLSHPLPIEYHERRHAYNTSTDAPLNKIKAGISVLRDMGINVRVV
jgi:hypothetical protein